MRPALSQGDTCALLCQSVTDAGRTLAIDTEGIVLDVVRARLVVQFRDPVTRERIIHAVYRHEVRET
jgi:hypothetical protein